jgi:threonine/homoserine/homoserine lactone efflux protein
VSDLILPDASRLGLFVAAAVVLLLTPGPAVLYIVTRSVDQGRRAGLVSVLGVHAGTLIHVAAAAAGLSAVLAASATAFSLVKYLGAGYLIYLGVRQLLSRVGEPADVTGAAAPPLSRAFIDGFVVNVLNPKTALFFLAFLPQFVTVSRGAVPAQIVCLGVIFVGLGLLTDGLYALTAGSAAQWLRARRGVALTRRWIPGTMYIGLGLATVLSPSNRK